MQYELKLNASISSHPAYGSLREALGMPDSHLAVARRSGSLGHVRLEGFLDAAVELKPQALAQHLDRLREANVTRDRPLGVPLSELLL